MLTGNQRGSENKTSGEVKKKKKILSLTYYRSRMWRKGFLKHIINQPLLTNSHNGTQLITLVLIDIFRNISMESM